VHKAAQVAHEDREHTHFFRHIKYRQDFIPKSLLISVSPLLAVQIASMI
jgi:hypothetical protein